MRFIPWIINYTKDVLNYFTKLLFIKKKDFAASVRKKNHETSSW